MLTARSRVRSLENKGHEARQAVRVLQEQIVGMGDYSKSELPQPLLSAINNLYSIALTLVLETHPDEQEEP